MFWATAAGRTALARTSVCASASDAARSDSSVPQTGLRPSFFAAVHGRMLACSPTLVRVAGPVHPCGWQESGTLRWCIGILAHTPRNEGARPYASLAVLVQQHAFRFLRVHRTVVQLVAVEEDFDERGARGDRALDERFRERVLDVLLQRAA